MSEYIQTSDLRVADAVPLPAPEELKKISPLSAVYADLIRRSRTVIANIMGQRDSRMLAIVGPCSIHDSQAACEYAERLKELSDSISDVLFIVMRVYFEKPRTMLGWRGLILDPHLDGSYAVDVGLQRARSSLIRITEIGLPAGSEMLDPIVPNYIDDLVSWASIGARTIESQTHREMASGLSMPVGFKNSTSGDVETALNAMASSLSPHSFIGINQQGNTCIVHTTGNKDVHIILRGGRSGPNFDPANIIQVSKMLQDRQLLGSILVDCSHGNSGKNPENQSTVLRSVIKQRCAGQNAVRGFMLESNLFAGRQDITESKLQYGISITDACISWDETEMLLVEAADTLRNKNVGDIS